MKAQSAGLFTSNEVSKEEDVALKCDVEKTDVKQNCDNSNINGKVFGGLARALVFITDTFDVSHIPRLLLKSLAKLNIPHVYVLAHVPSR